MAGRGKLQGCAQERTGALGPLLVMFERVPTSTPLLPPPTHSPHQPTPTHLRYFYLPANKPTKLTNQLTAPNYLLTTHPQVLQAAARVLRLGGRCHCGEPPVRGQALEPGHAGLPAGHHHAPGQCAAALLRACGRAAVGVGWACKVSWAVRWFVHQIAKARHAGLLAGCDHVGGQFGAT